MVALGSPKTDIGAAFRQPDAPDQLAVRIPHRDSGIAQYRVGAGPDIAGPVHPHPVGVAINSIHHTVGEVAQARHLAVCHLADMNTATDDIDALVVRRKANAVWSAQLLGGYSDLQPA